MMKNSTKFLIAALVIGITIRAGLLWITVLDTGVLIILDQPTYINLAAGLVEHRDFGAWFTGERVPVYPTFLALCHLATGSALTEWTLPQQTLILAVIVQNILGLLSVIGMYYTGRLISNTIGALCASLTLLNITMAMYCNQILTEALFTPFMAIIWYLLLCYQKTGYRRHLLWLSISLGIATLIRTVTMYFPLFMIPYLLIGSKKTLKQKLADCIVFSIVFAFCLFPWIGRNLYIFGHAGMTTQYASHMAGWIIPAIAQNEEGISLEEARNKYNAHWDSYRSLLPEETQKDSFALQKEAKKYFFRYLKTVSWRSIAKAWVEGALKNLMIPIALEGAYLFQMDWTHFSEIPGSSFGEQAWNFVVHNKNRFFSFLLIAGMAVTLIARAVQCAGMGLLFLHYPGVLKAGVLIIVYFLAVSGPIGYAKYRLPFEPVLILFTAVALSRLRFFVKEKENIDAGYF